jgi:hypothetical protein
VLGGLVQGTSRSLSPESHRETSGDKQTNHADPHRDDRASDDDLDLKDQPKQVRHCNKTEHESAEE